MEFDFSKDFMVLAVWFIVSLTICLVGNYLEKKRGKKASLRGATKIK